MKRLDVRPLSSPEDAEWCARTMSSTDPWLTLRRGQPECLAQVSNPERETWIGWRGAAIMRCPSDHAVPPWGGSR